MNKYQMVIKKAMNSADVLTEKRGRAASYPINTDNVGVVALKEYFYNSLKWVSSSRGYMTIDSMWVVTLAGHNIFIGRNY